MTFWLIMRKSSQLGALHDDFKHASYYMFYLCVPMCFPRYLNGPTYRRMVTEMLDSRSFAISGLMVYLEDETSEIHDVLFASGRQLHDRYVKYLRKLLSTSAEDQRRQISEDLCRAMNLLDSKIGERDREGQTQLMIAAAQGNIEALELLVAAGEVLLLLMIRCICRKQQPFARR